MFITALSVPLLREHVGWRRWGAVIVGFAGVLIIVRPGASAFQPASLYVVATAALYAFRSEEHTSELQSLMRISYAVFCLKKKTNKNNRQHTHTHETTLHTQ